MTKSTELRTNFSDSLFFLSMLASFEPCVINGIAYTTITNFMAAMRITDVALRKFVAEEVPARYVGRFMRNLELSNSKVLDLMPEDALPLMDFILWYKFHPEHNPMMYDALYEYMDSHGAPSTLIYLNNWGDWFWGVSPEAGAIYDTVSHGIDLDIQVEDLPVNGDNHYGLCITKLWHEIKSAGYKTIVTTRLFPAPPSFVEHSDCVIKNLLNKAGVHIDFDLID